MKPRQLTALLSQLARSAPALRDAGVTHVRLDGVGEMTVGVPRQAAAKATDQPKAPTPKEAEATARSALKDTGLNDTQAGDVLANLRRFD